MTPFPEVVKGADEDDRRLSKHPVVMSLVHGIHIDQALIVPDALWKIIMPNDLHLQVIRTLSIRLLHEDIQADALAVPS